MPNYILNSTENLYHSLEDFLATIVTSEATDSYLLLFTFPIEDLFEKIKRRSALRAKLARDDKGNSQTEHFQLTEDERDIFMDFLRTGSAEIFKQISGFSKSISAAYRFDVFFGDPEFASTISGVSVDGLTLSDSLIDVVVNQYAGMKLVITTAGLLQNKEATIVSNTENTFVIDAAFSGDVTGLDYIVTAQTEKFIVIYSILDLEKFDTNVILGLDGLFEKCFRGTVLRDWYLINRFMDDYQIEEKLLKDAISDLRMHYFQSMSTYRATQFFNDDDTIED